jgi:hypothetical protein
MGICMAGSKPGRARMACIRRYGKLRSHSWLRVEPHYSLVERDARVINDKVFVEQHRTGELWPVMTDVFQGTLSRVRLLESGVLCWLCVEPRRSLARQDLRVIGDKVLVEQSPIGELRTVKTVMCQWTLSRVRLPPSVPRMLQNQLITRSTRVFGAQVSVERDLTAERLSDTTFMLEGTL